MTLAGAAQLLAEVGAEAFHDRGRVGLLDLDEHLPLAAAGAAHAGREVHAEQGEGCLHGLAIVSGRSVSGDRQLLRAQLQRLDVEPGDARRAARASCMRYLKAAS